MRGFAGALRGLLLAALLAASLVLAACGDSDESDSGSTGEAAAASTQSASTTEEAAAAPETETLKIALYPSTDYAALYAGIEDGTFAEHGLELEVEQVLTGTAITAAVTSGDADLGTNSATAGATGIINGLPIIMVSSADIMPTDGYVEVLVRTDSGIDSFKDLEGKKVATINLEGSFELATLTAVASEGGDPSTVKALAMAPTDEPAALKAGRVDAIVLQDPFVATAKKDPDFKSLGNPFETFSYPVVSGGFFASNDTVAKKTDALNRFREALAQVSEKVQADPDIARKIIPTYTELPADVADTIGLPVYDTAIPPGAMTSMMEDMKKYGWIDEVPPENEVVWDGQP